MLQTQTPGAIAFDRNIIELALKSPPSNKIERGNSLLKNCSLF